MTQIEQIKAEIERCIAALEKCGADKTEGYAGEISGLKRLLHFINSLQAEPVSEDLEKELNNRMNSIYPLPEEDDFDDPCYSISNAIKSQRIGFKKGFEIGANWQKEQILKDAVDGVISIRGKRSLVMALDKLKQFRYGNKVKLIIVKED